MQTTKSDGLAIKLLKTQQIVWMNQQKFPKVQSKDEINFFISRPLPTGSLYSKKHLAKTLVMKQNTNASNQTLFNNKNSVPDLDPVCAEEICSSRSVHTYRKRNTTITQKRSNPSLVPSVEKKPQVSHHEKSDDDSPFVTPFLQLVKKNQAQSEEIVKLKNEIKGLLQHNWIKDLERKYNTVKKLNESVLIENKHQDYQATIDDLKEQLKRVTQGSSIKEDQVSPLHQKIITQQDTIDEQSGSLKQLQQKLESSQQTSKQLEYQIKTQKLEINRLSQTLQDKVKELNEKNNQIALLFEKEKNLKVSMNLTKKNMSSHKQKELLTDLKKLLDAVKPSVSCTLCRKYYSNPVTLIPCAHSFCQSCLNGTPDICVTCGGKTKVEAAYQNDLVQELTSIFQMMWEMFQQLSTFV